MKETRPITSSFIIRHYYIDNTENSLGTEENVDIIPKTTGDLAESRSGICCTGGDFTEKLVTISISDVNDKATMQHLTQNNDEKTCGSQRSKKADGNTTENGVANEESKLLNGTPPLSPEEVRILVPPYPWSPWGISIIFFFLAWIVPHYICGFGMFWALFFNSFPIARTLFDGRFLNYVNLIPGSIFVIQCWTRFTYLFYLETKEKKQLMYSKAMVFSEPDINDDMEKGSRRWISALDSHGRIRREVDDATDILRRDQCTWIVFMGILISTVMLVVFVPVARILDRFHHPDDGLWLTVEFAFQKYRNVSDAQLARWQE